MNQEHPAIDQALSKAAEEIIRPLIPKDSKDRVMRSFKQWNLAVREHIRSETGLKLSEGDSRFSIPVKIVEGFPRPLAELIAESHDPVLWRLIVGQPKLGGIIEGLEFLLEDWDRVERWPHLPEEARNGKPSIEKTLEITNALQQKILKLQIEDEFKSFVEDILGMYRYKYLARSSWVELYWMPIAMVAAMLDLRIEDMTIVVLIHELAHGYTHVGRDIDGASWEDGDFFDSDKEVIEGLAQHYTEVITERMLLKAPGARQAYEKLLTLQGDVYHSHETWFKGEQPQRGEIVRFAIITARTVGAIEDDNWRDLLKNTEKGLRG